MRRWELYSVTLILIVKILTKKKKNINSQTEFHAH
jgi:hypothetical protein